MHSIIKDGFSSLSDKFQSLDKKTIVSAVAIGAVTTGVVGLAIRGVKKRRTAKRKKTIKKKSRKLKFGSPAYRKKYLHHGRTKKGRAKARKRHPHYARTAGKGKDTSRRRIRQTKHGQPYIILASGKARFISKASARASRKRKGGRY